MHTLYLIGSPSGARCIYPYKRERATVPRPLPSSRGSAKGRVQRMGKRILHRRLHILGRQPLEQRAHFFSSSGGRDL